MYSKNENLCRLKIKYCFQSPTAPDFTISDEEAFGQYIASELKPTHSKNVYDAVKLEFMHALSEAKEINHQPYKIIRIPFHDSLKTRF